MRTTKADLEKKLAERDEEIAALKEENTKLELQRDTLIAALAGPHVNVPIVYIPAPIWPQIVWPQAPLLFPWGGDVWCGPRDSGGQPMRSATAGRWSPGIDLQLESKASDIYAEVDQVHFGGTATRVFGLGGGVAFSGS